MADEPDIPEVPAAPIEIAETHFLFRLTPATEDLAQRSRQVAIVPAESELQARQIAQTADPFGRDWLNPSLFVCDRTETPERHVIGDVIFKSVAAPSIRNPKRAKPSTS
jgi:hypothetical protein